MNPTFSVIVPAQNEEDYLSATLDAIRSAEARLGEPVDVIVADNRSTDLTCQVAVSFWARVVTVSATSKSAMCNQAATEAIGKYIVFQDAGNCMSPDVLVEIKRRMDTGRYVGGGVVNSRYDRDSLGLRMVHGFEKLSLAVNGVSTSLLYTTPAHFYAIGGFDEGLLATEDYDFAVILKEYGRSHGLRYLNLRHSEMILSSHKFDEYGDWAVFRRPGLLIRACFNNPQAAYELWRKPRREKSVIVGQSVPLRLSQVQREA